MGNELTIFELQFYALFCARFESRLTFKADLSSYKPQELCIVCKGYVENKNKRTLLTYSFVIDTIKIQDDINKRRILYVLYANDYI